MTTANPFLGHELRPPRLNSSEAAAALRQSFGLEGELQPLGSHQDQNFSVDTPEGRFVLKVANSAFSRAELDLQNRAMEHVAAELPGVVPVPLRTADGRDIVEFEGHLLRLVTYMDGTPLREFTHLAQPVLNEAGRLAGKVAAALKAFEHPASERILQWDVKRAADVTSAFAGDVPDAARRDLAERTMERAAQTLERLAPDLRNQVIHGDATDWNLLATTGVAGRPIPTSLIDFGDVVHSWLAAECAVLATMIGTRRHRRVLQNAKEVVHGFNAVFPLTEAEIAALPALMAARAVISVLGGERQRALEPANQYVAHGVNASWDILFAVAAMSPRLLEAVLREACGLPPHPAPRIPRTGHALSPEFGRRAPVSLDLSVRSDVFPAGGWRDRAELSRHIAELWADGVLPIGRYGERRLVHDVGPEADEPATFHLGIDFFLPEGAPLAAPLAAHVVHAEERELLLEADDGLHLRLAGIEPARLSGRIPRGGELGSVAPPEPGARLPAHVHLQLAGQGLDDLPGLVPASLASAWRSMCPDPGPLLGFDAAAPPDPLAPALERRQRWVASPQRLYYTPEPPQIERGWRQWLYDVDGRPYLDVINNVAIVGHSHPKVEAAAARQLRRLNTNSRFLYDAMPRFAERLARLVPDPLDVVFFVNSGSEANDLALRLARTATGHRDLLCFEDSYHGWTTAMSEAVTAEPWVHAVLRPHPDPELSLQTLLETVDRLATKGGGPAAFLCEPVLGYLGGITLPSGYLRDAYAAVRDAGGLCIADEVQVGYGRLGRYFWAFEEQQVVPDIVTIAKATGNGHPVAAVITTRDVADAFGEHESLFSSVGGSPVSCEVGLAVLDALQEERLQENAWAVGEHLDERLGVLIEEFEIVRGLHGIGLYRALELCHDGGQPAPDVARAICERMLELGVIVQPTGPSGNLLKLKPPLCVSAVDIDFLAAALRETLIAGW